MKKITAIALALALIISLVSCETEAEPEPAAQAADIVVLVPYEKKADDSGVNAACMEGVDAFCAETGMTGETARPLESGDEAMLALCRKKAEAGAKVIIVNCDELKRVAYAAAAELPDVKFIVYNTVPVDENGNEKITANTLVVDFAVEQIAYLIGYASVLDGFKKFGFIASETDKHAQRYGYGFVAGINAAAVAKRVRYVQIIYHYLPADATVAQCQARISSWYKHVTEVTFAVDAPVGDSSIGECAAYAINQYDGWLLGTDYDLYPYTSYVISSAMKNFSGVTKSLLDKWKAGALDTGGTIELSITDDAMCIPMNISRWLKFSPELYGELYERAVTDDKGMMSDIPTLEDYPTPDDLKVNKTYVTLAPIA